MLIHSPVSSVSDEEVLFEELGGAFLRIERPIFLKERLVEIMGNLAAIHRSMQVETNIHTHFLNKSLQIALIDQRWQFLDSHIGLVRAAKLARVLRVNHLGFHSISSESPFADSKIASYIARRRDVYAAEMEKDLSMAFKVDISAPIPQAITGSTEELIPYYWPVRCRFNLNLENLIGERGEFHYHLLPVDGSKKVLDPHLILAERLGLGLNLFSYKVEGSLDSLILKRVHYFEYHLKDKKNYQIIQIARKNLNLNRDLVERFDLAARRREGLAAPTILSKAIAEAIESPIDHDEPFIVEEEAPDVFFAAIKLTVEDRMRQLRHEIFADLKANLNFWNESRRLRVNRTLLEYHLDQEGVVLEIKEEILEALSKLFYFNCDDLEYGIFPNHFHHFYEIFLAALTK